MLRRLLPWAFALLAAPGCAETEGGDASVDGDAAPPVELVCDPVKKRAQTTQSYACAAAPVTVEGTIDGDSFEIFAYEASHPTATAELSFPCEDADLDEDGLPDRFRAPETATEPCSVAGVRPWHTVKHTEAKQACESIGWRLCAPEELTTICAGETGAPYPASPTLVGGQCNLRSINDGDMAPTGQFEQCTAGNGAFDLNGNLWEWSAKRDVTDDGIRFYQGAGYKIVAQQHADAFLTCSSDVRLPALSARSFASETVGFRCCRNRP